jgi:GNAT superfamily N-acetyltransferase
VTVRVEPLTGAALRDRLPDLARLRIEVFREYPYLYEGDLPYEERYLAGFADAHDAVIVAAFAGVRIIGAATAAPLAAQPEVFRAPLSRSGIPVEECFYFGESVLLPEFRGRGIGHEFFDEREAHARSFPEVRAAVFCAVVREEDHPARPAAYRPHDRFWRKRGYEPLPGVTGRLAWPESPGGDAIEHEMQYWLRHLPRGRSR